MAAPGRDMLIPLGQILQRHIEDPGTVRKIMRMAATATDTIDFIKGAMKMGREAANVANDVQHWIQQTESTWTEFRTQVANQVATWASETSGLAQARRNVDAAQRHIDMQDRQATQNNQDQVLNDIIDTANRNNPFNTGQGQLNSGATPVRDIGTGGRSRIHQNDPMDASGRVEPVPEAAARSGGGGGGPSSVSKETPISNYPSLNYGLQETHTTILPYVTWCTLALDKSATTPIQLKVRMNSIYDMLDIAIVAPPNDDSIFTGPGFTSKKVGFNGKSPINGNAYPVVPSTGTTATERPQWRDYWAQIYQYYTVLGCEYEIIHVNPIGNHDTINTTPGNRVYGGDIICAEQVDTYSDTAAATGNVMPLTILQEVMNFKNIKWHRIESNGVGNNFGNTMIVKGKYTPGSEKRNIVNDGDVKTWTAVGSQPNLKEFLTLNYWPHPMSAGTAFGANMQIRLKYIVQFKDLVAQARYPNSLNTTGNVQQDIRNADLAAQTLSDDVRQSTG